MANNHLIIGIGGTGGKVIAQFRNLVVQQHGDLNLLNNNNNKVDFLWIDSSTEITKRPDIGKDPNLDWVANGKDLFLDDKQRLFLEPGGLQSVIENSGNYPAIQPWIGTYKDWGAIAKDAKIQTGASGQVRKLGRLNFARKINEFIDKYTRLESSLLTDRSKDLYVHIIAGMAGGTGSGVILDLAAQIAKIKNKQTKVFLYLVMPSNNVPQEHKAFVDNISFYFANGYAALKELNAFAVNVSEEKINYQFEDSDFAIVKFNPYDLNYRGKLERIETTEPFHMAYIITDETTHGYYTPSEIWRRTADFIYARTLLIHAGGTAGQAMKRADDTENNLVSPTSAFGLSGNFSLFGISRLYIPKQEMKDYFIYSYILNGVNRLLFNEFVNGQGYIKPDPEKYKIQDQYRKIRDSQYTNIYREWLLDSDHIRLNMVENDIPLIHSISHRENIQKIEDDLLAYSNKAFLELKNSIVKGRGRNGEGKSFDQRNLLEEFQRTLTDYSNNEFRGHNIGYIKYFNDWKEDVNTKKYADYIISKIDEYIFGKSKSNPFDKFNPLQLTLKTIQEIREEYLKIKAKDIKEQIERRNVLIDKNKKIFDNLVAEYAGTFGLIPNKKKRDKIEKLTQQILRERWTAKIDIASFEFSLKLINVLKESLKEIEEKCKTAVSNIDDLGKAFNLELKKLSLFNTDHNTNSYTRSLADEKKIKEIDLKLRSDEGKKILDKKLENIMDDLSKAFNLGKIGGNLQSIVQSIKNDVYKKADDILNDEFFSSLKEENIYKTNLIDILNTKYKDVDNPELVSLIQEQYRQSYVNAVIEQGNYSDVKNKHLSIIILPRYDKENTGGYQFKERLRDYIRHNVVDGSEPVFVDGQEDDELIFIKITYCLVTGQLPVISKLYQEYQTIRSAKSGDFDPAFVMHLESGEKIWPELVIPDNNGKKKLFAPLLLIMKAMNKFQMMEGKLSLPIYDSNGSLSPEKSFFFKEGIKETILNDNSHDPSFLGNRTSQDYFKFRFLTIEALKKNGNSTSIRQDMLNYVNDVLKEAGVRDKYYQFINEAYNQACEIIGQH